MDNQFILELLARLDKNQSAAGIQADLKEIEKKISGVSFKVNPDFDVKNSEKEYRSNGEQLGRSLAEGLIKAYAVQSADAKKEITQIAQDLAKIRINELTTNTQDSSFIEMIDKLGQAVINNAHVIEQRQGIYDKFYETFKGMSGFKFSDSVVQQLGDDWNDMRKLYPNKFVRVADGLELDSQYQQLNGYFPELFPDVSDQVKQFQLICEAIRQYRQDVDQIKPIDPKDVGITDDIYTSVITGMAQMDEQIKASSESAKSSSTDIDKEAQSLKSVNQSAILATVSKEDFTKANKELKKSADESSDSIDDEYKSLMDMDNVDSIMRGLCASAGNANNVFKQMGDDVAKMFYAFSLASIARKGISEVQSGIRDMASVVKELDDALTNISYTMNLTDDQLSSIGYQSLQMASDLHTSATNVLQAVQLYANAKESADSILAKSAPAIMLSNAAGFSGEQSAKYLQTIANQFDYEQEQMMEISDIIQTVSKNIAYDFSAGIEQINAGISASGSVAKSAGIDLAQYSAIIGTLVEKTGQQGSSLGRAVQTIIARTTKAGKLLGLDEDISKAEAALRNVDIEIRKDADHFRDFGDIMSDLSKKWNDLSDLEQSNISYELAGTRQTNVLKTLANNWQEIVDITEKANNSTGTTLENQEKYAQSLQGLTEDVKVSFQQLAVDTISEDDYAAVLKMSKAMLDWADSTGIVKGAMAGLATALTVSAFNSFLGFTRSAVSELSNYGQALSMVRAGQITEQTDLQQLINLTGGLTQSQVRLLVSTNTLTDAQRVAIIENNLLAQGISQQAAHQQALTMVQQMATGSTISLSNAMKGLAASMIANPIMLLTAAVTAGTMVWQKYSQEVRDAEEATKQAIDKSRQHSEEVTELSNKYNSLTEEIKSNASAKDSLEETTNQLLAKLGAEGTSVSDLIDKYGDLNTAINSLTLDVLKDDALNLITGVSNAADELKEVGKSGFLQRNIIKGSGDEANQMADILSQSGYNMNLNRDRDSVAYLMYDDDSSVDGIINNYNRLKGAIDAIRDSNQFTATELQNNDFFQGMLSRYNELDDAVSSYKNAISDLNANVAQQQILTGLQGHELPNTEEEFNTFKENVIQSAQDSKQFIGSTDQISQAINTALSKMPQFAQYFGTIAEEAEESAGEIKRAWDKKDMISAINGMSEGFEELDKIMQSQKSKDPFNFSLLDDKKFKETFEGLGEEYENFVETISSSPKDIDACQDAYNNLIDSWIASTGILDNVNDSNASLTASMLSNMGVTNAQKLVDDALMNTKIQLADQTKYLSEMTDEEKDAFYREVGATEESKDAFNRYYAQKLLAEFTIDVNGDIQALKAEITALGLATSNWTAYYRAKANQATLDGMLDKGTINAKQYAELSQANTEKAEYFNKKYSEELSKVGSNYGGGNKSNKPTGGSGGGGGSSKSNKEPTSFDWMEQKIKNLDKQIDDLKANMDEVVGYNEKNKFADSIITDLNQKLPIYQAMIARYKEEMDALAVPAEYIQKINDGSIEIDKISDQTLAKNIKEYQSWRDKIDACTKSIKDTKKEILSMGTLKIDNIITQFSHLETNIKNCINTQEQLIELAEKTGDRVDASDYLDLIDRQTELAENASEAYEKVASQMARLNLKEGSEEWQKYNNQLQTYRNNMLSAANAVEKYKDKMEELTYKVIEDFQTSIDRVNGTIGTMRKLIGTVDLTDGTGNLTERGLAQVALYVQELKNANKASAEYANAMNSLKKALDKGLITQDEYNKRLSDYRSEQEQAVEATKDARDSILELAKEGIQAEIDAKAELIEQTKSQLDAEKNLSDYRDTVSDKMKKMAVLEKQIATLSLSSDRSDMRQKLELQEQLSELQKELYQTTADHEVDTKKDALDEELKTFTKEKEEEKKALDTDLTKQEQIINRYLNQVQTNYETVYGVLTEYGNAYNLEATEDLTSPWESGSNAANTCASAIGGIVSEINLAINSIDTSALDDLIEKLQSLSDYGVGGSVSGGSDYEDISDQGKWQKGKGGKWWFGEPYSEDDDYWYADSGYYNINGKTYGFDDQGYMLTEWDNNYSDDGNWHYFDANTGAMQKEQWIEGKGGKWYYLGRDGEMVTDAAVQSKEDSDKYYYLDDDGVWDNQTRTIDDLKRNGMRKYRIGTRNAIPGIALTDEEGLGSEAIITKDGALRQLDSGDHVFTAEQTARLHEIADNTLKYVELDTTSGIFAKADELLKSIGQATTLKQNIFKPIDPNLMGGSGQISVSNSVIVQGDASERTVALIQNCIDDFAKNKMGKELMKQIRYSRTGK